MRHHEDGGPKAIRFTGIHCRCDLLTLSSLARWLRRTKSATTVRSVSAGTGVKVEGGKGGGEHEGVG